MTDDELAEYVTHDVLGDYRGDEPEQPGRGCWYTLAAILLFALLAVLF